MVEPIIFLSAVTMEVIPSSETSVHINITRCYIPEVGKTDLIAEKVERVHV
jgi:hypothetical protein